MSDNSLARKESRNAFYRGTVALHDLANHKVVPILVGIVEKTGFDEAVVGNVSPYATVDARALPSWITLSIFKPS